MKSRKMPKALGQSHCKVKINQMQCPVLPRMFFKSEILSAIPNHYCLYSHYFGDTGRRHPNEWHVIHFKASHQSKKGLCK